MPPPAPLSRLGIGGVAASATAGALVAMGHRLGRAALPFAEIGALALPRAPSRSGAVIATGLALHVGVTILWTLVFVWLADRLNRSLVPAIMVGAANFFASWLVARATGHGIASVLPLGDRLTLALVLVVTLVVGMRYARSSSRNA